MNTAPGTIFELREFCLHDGPGIRTTVFFKGCPLRCRWCHNPEGLTAAPQLLVRASGCRGCGNCRRVCPTPDHCSGCGRCVAACPENCRRICGERRRPAELAAAIRRGGELLRESGGGVTFSGGEPLAQADFLLALAAELADFHRAIETSGYAPEATYRRMLDAVDLVIQDLKCADPARHRELTGVDPTPIFANLRTLQRAGKPYWIRIPLIPGVNDSDAELAAFAAMLRDAPTPPREVQLLSYHHAAGAKYPQLGQTYALTIPPAARSNGNCRPFLAAGLNCRFCD